MQRGIGRTTGGRNDGGRVLKASRVQMSRGVDSGEQRHHRFARLHAYRRAT